jgi:micrococcal nuclease
VLQGGLVHVLTAAAGALLLLAGCGGDAAGPDGTAAPSPRAALPAGMPEPPRDAFEATVERVVDGDTFVAVRDGRRVRVRLIGVDAPESVKPDAPVECYGREASALLNRLLPPDAQVRAAYQTDQHRDVNGRDLWDVWLADGRFLQAVLVREGAVDARRYRPQVAHAEYLEAVERVARESGAGLHGAC